MTTDFDGPMHNFARHDFLQLEAHSASDLQLAEGENLSSRALAIITPTLFSWANRKNVTLQPEGVEVVAQYALERIPTDSLGSLLAFDEDALRAMRLAINFTLDVLATMQLGHCLAELEGGEFPDSQRLLAIAEENVSAAHALAADPLGPIVWGDLMELAAQQRQALRSKHASEAEHA